MSPDTPALLAESVGTPISGCSYDDRTTGRAIGSENVTNRRNPLRALAGTD
jgi:hypothetical protein